MIGDWLETLGMQNVSESRSGARCNCPFHADDSQTLSVHGSRYRCFSASCGMTGTIWDLAKRLGTKVPDWVILAQTTPEPLVELEEIPEYSIAGLPFAYEMCARGLSREDVEAWGLRRDESEPGVLIPVRDHQGRFVSRAWRREDSRMRYRNEAGMPRDQILYGLDRVLAAYPGVNHVALVEGFGDAWKAQACGVPAVATLGALLSLGQAMVLQSAGVTRISLMYDNDAAGWQGAVAAYDTVSDFMHVDFAMQYAGHWPKDPGEANRVIAQRLWDHREGFAEFWSRTSDLYTTKTDRLIVDSAHCLLIHYNEDAREEPEFPEWD